MKSYILVTAVKSVYKTQYKQILNMIKKKIQLYQSTSLMINFQNCF